MPSQLMLDRSDGSAHGVYATEYQAKVVPPGAWAGPALLGNATLDATVGAWPAGNEQDIRWTVTVPPHWSTGVGEWCEVFVATAEEDPDITPGFDADYLEPAFIFEAAGTLRVGLDWAITVEDATTQWVSDVVGDWRVGVPRAVWRLTVTDGGSGAFTFRLYRDGVLLQTDATTGKADFETPPAGSPLQVGPVSSFLTPIHSAEIRDGIDGPVLYSFDAAAPTGWTPLDGGAGIFTAPDHPSFSIPETYQVPDPPVADIAAGDSFTWVWRLTATPVAAAVAFYTERDVGAAVAATGPGWGLVDAPGAGVPHAFVIGDGVDTIIVDVGAVVADTETTIGVTLNRVTDTLTAYRNGAEVDEADATALGAVSPNAAVIFQGRQLLATTGMARRALTPVEHLALHYEMANA